MIFPAERVFVFFGGLAGAAGVGLAARAAHGADDLQTPANFLLFHAPAFLALAALAPNLFRRVGGLTLAVGLALFCGDLLMRHATGHRLFPFAAPAGGTLTIAGWAVVTMSAFVRPRE